jgi:Deoxyribonuclease NucA/NucB/Immunoglobulin I-set domain
MSLTAVQRALRVVVLALAAATVAACGGDKEAVNESGASNADAARVEVQGAANARGASVSHAPRGANTPTVRVAGDANGAPPLPNDARPAGTVVQFTPLGLALGAIDIRVPFDAAALPAGSAPRLWIAMPGQGWAEVADARIEGQAMVGRVPMLTHAVVVARPLRDAAASRAHAASARNATRAVAAAAPEPTAEQPITTAVNAQTTPALPAPGANGIIAVTQPTDFYFDVEYLLPACATQPRMRSFVVFVPQAVGGEQPPTRTFEFGDFDVQFLRDGFVGLKNISADVNGQLTFNTSATCTETVDGQAVQRYALLHTGFVIDVNIQNGPEDLPLITQAPANQVATVGQSVTFSVAASGSALSYQWQRSDSSGNNYADVPGASAASLTVTAALADDASLWRVIVSNAAGSATSMAARLSVAEGATAPAISADPRDQTVLAGQTASFTVAATGSPTPGVQWQQRASATAEWSNIAGATALTYTTAPTTLAQSGAQYRAVLQNSAGSATSLAATLTVTEGAVAPSITTQPTSQSVQAGQSGLFSVTASGSSPLGYQWFKDGVAIVGANASEVLVPTAVADAGQTFQISVQVSNAAGSVTSAVAVMSVTAVTTDPGTTVLIDAARGGEVRGADDVVLQVPAGALTSNTSVTLRSVPAGELTVPADATLIGNAVSITPSGLSFSSPAVLSLAIPENLVLAAGQALALLELSGTAGAATTLGSGLAQARNLRRMAASGVRVVPGASAAAAGADKSCLSPGSIVGGRAVVNALTGGLKALATVPQSACSSSPVQSPAYGVPSSTTEACANDADYGSADGGNEETLVNRHVQCARYLQTASVDKWNADGTIQEQNVGEVSLDARLAVYGKSSAGPQKSVQLKIGYTYLPRPGNNFPAPSLKVKAVFACGASSSGVACDRITEARDISPGISAGTITSTLNFTWPGQSSEAPVRTELVAVRLLFTVDGSAPANEQGGRTYSADLPFYAPSLRCDVNQAKAGTSGCVFDQAAAVFTLLPTDPQTQSRQHIKDAFAGLTIGLSDLPAGTVLNVLGKFTLQPGTRAIAVPGGALERSRVQKDINDRRQISNSRCKRLFGPPPPPTPEVCEAITDVDNVPGPCDCDEYPFASSRQGASLDANDRYSVRRISGSDNRSAGGKLGAMFSIERVVNGEFFWVAVPD